MDGGRREEGKNLPYKTQYSAVGRVEYGMMGRESEKGKNLADRFGKRRKVVVVVIVPARERQEVLPISNLSSPYVGTNSRAAQPQPRPAAAAFSSKHAECGGDAAFTLT